MIVTATFVARVKRPGRYGDGRRASGFGFGGGPRTSDSARIRWCGSRTRGRTRWRTGGRSIGGHDPREAGVPNFEAAAEKEIEIHWPTWKNPPRMAGQWRQTLRDYAYPRIGLKRVGEVTTADVLAILKPIWSSKPANAKAVRNRISAVLRCAVAKGYRPDDPAGDAIAAALPRNGNTTRHHKALPHGEVAAALAKIRNSESDVGIRLALEFMVLTATRSSEVRGAAWEEVDRDVWTIPASRMKAKREPRVPLSGRALEILEEARKHHDGGIVFRGVRGGAIHASMFGKLLGDLGIKGTSHGMRSSFRDRCAETSGCARWRRRRLHTRSAVRPRPRTPARTCSTGGARSWRIGPNASPATEVRVLLRLLAFESEYDRTQRPDDSGIDY